MVDAEASNHRKTISKSQPNNQHEIVEQLLPALGHVIDATTKLVALDEKLGEKD